jgi:hypothetical protein
MRGMHPFSKRASHYHIRWPDGVDERAYDSNAEAMMRAEQLARPDESFSVERCDGGCEICSPREC